MLSGDDPESSTHPAVYMLRTQELPQAIFAPFGTDTAVLVADERGIWPHRAAAVDLNRADPQPGNKFQALICRAEDIGLQAQF